MEKKTEGGERVKLRFPKHLLMGAASAAAQIEGGEVDSSWNDWYHRGHIKDGSDPAAHDHWERWQEDVELMARLNVQVCRFGVEWARLVPRLGQVDEAAVARYRAELTALRERGIRPLLTIHHFANPMWFERKGGFARRENLGDFLELVELVVRRLGDLVSEYITINEPNVYAFNGYGWGLWPPGKKSYAAVFPVLENMAWCHIRAYGMIHAIRSEMRFEDTMVGFANHLRVFDPADGKNPWHRFCAGLAEWLFQGAVTRAMTLGEFKLPLRNRGKLPRGQYADFNGVNYYSRSTVSGLKDGVRPDSPRNDLDWEIYPDGLGRCARKLNRVLERPIWVTENGTCDNDDRFRARYLYDHWEAMIHSGLPFERYYHWCFCDNFEWIEGNSARFGLVHVDYAGTRARSIKASGQFFAGAVAAGGVTEELYDRYVKDEVYDIR